eukprot:TRINITY_DN16405_c0_g1_i1.p1 TRINITY_DN16405_c0_g1~~TRINITY_DN16405_c0_g1_i1.p1  ORF type:complete len:465 (+),score=79.44 TRINITY_DN16405_c0_g1_i1:69-1397(+)
MAGGLSGPPEEICKAICSGKFDSVIQAWTDRAKQLLWERMPDRVVLLRHGQSEGNVDSSLYATKGDSQLELTPQGIEQARLAGLRLSKLMGKEAADGNVFVVLSPFERAQQTLLGLHRGGFPEQTRVHIDSRVREQEFGNFQNPGLGAAVRAEENVVGRFYYRRPNAESSADVLDRVSSFWNSLLSDGDDSLLLKYDRRYENVLIVTHGLTIRLLLMFVNRWSVDTFESVWNMHNCDHITLKKCGGRYDMCPQESHPSRLPWATRSVWVAFKSCDPSAKTVKRFEVLQKAWDETLEQKPPASEEEDRLCRWKDEALKRTGPEYAGDNTWVKTDQQLSNLETMRLLECSRPYTVVDFLSIPQPRTARPSEALTRLVEGHDLRGSPDELMRVAADTSIDPADIDFIDWWGPRVSFRGKMLRTQIRGHKELKSLSPTRARSGECS